MGLRARPGAAVCLVGSLSGPWRVFPGRGPAIHAGGEPPETRARRANLEGRRAALDRRIRTAEGRAVLVPRAQAKLGLHLPADSEMILLPLPGSGNGSR